MLGAVLGLLYVKGTPLHSRLPVLSHGLLGLGGLGLLTLSLRGPRRGDAMGVGSFGLTAAVLFGIALILALGMTLLKRRAPKTSGVMIAAHATVAITGYTLFLAWVSMG